MSLMDFVGHEKHLILQHVCWMNAYTSTSFSFKSRCLLSNIVNVQFTKVILFVLLWPWHSACPMPTSMSNCHCLVATAVRLFLSISFKHFSMGKFYYCILPRSWTSFHRYCVHDLILKFVKEWWHFSKLIRSKLMD